MDEDEDYVPSDEHGDKDSEEDALNENDLEEDFDDETAFLTTNRGQDAGDEEEDDAAPEHYFGEGFDPMSLLDKLGQHEKDFDPAVQSYGGLRQSKHGDGPPQVKEKPAGASRGAKRSRGEVYGASVDDIWDEDQVAEELGFGSGRRKRSSRRRQRGSKAPSRSRHIPEEINMKVGDATMAYTMGRYDDAIRLLMEVIKVHPYLQDTYHTLGLAHEALGRPRQALDFYMIAVHMAPSDVDLWRRLASLSTNLGFFRQAIYCYSKVIARDRDDWDAKYDRALLYGEVNEPKKAVTAFEQILTKRPGDPEAVKSLARLYHQLGSPERSSQVLEQQVRDFPDATDLTHINILAELFMDAGKYEQASNLIRQAERLPCMQDGVPVDLRVRAGICAAQLQDMDAALEHFHALFAVDAVDFADLYLIVGDMLSEQRHFDEALVFYSRLAEHSRQSTPEVWSKLAGCHQALGSYEAAVGILHKILGGLFQCVPLHACQDLLSRPCYALQRLKQQEHADLSLGAEAHAEAATALAELYVGLGQPAAALEVLYGLQGAGAVLPRQSPAVWSLHWRRASLFLKLDHTEPFLDLMLPVLSRTLRTSEAASAATASGKRMGAALRRRARIAQKYAQTQEHGAVFKGFVTRDRRKDSAREADQQLVELEQAYADDLPDGIDDGAGAASEAGDFVLDDVFNDQSQFEAILHTLRVLLGSGQPQEAQQLTDNLMRMFSKRGTDRDKKDALRMVLGNAAAAQGDSAGALQHIRYVAANHPHSPLVWNAYARAAACSGSMRSATRYLLGMVKKHPDSVPLMVLLGNSHMMTGNYNAALQEYLRAYRIAPQEPLVLLCMGVAILNRVMQKKVPDRNRAFLQALAFLQEYAEQRCSEQEACYNLGRAAHQLRLLHVAVPFYERALAANPPPDSSSADLRREAAHNLVLICRSTGATGMARQVMREHLTF